jgi:lipopolysaccharide export system permease protein
MTIFFKSILKEYISTCSLVLAALVLVVTITQLARYLGYAVGGNHAFSSVTMIYFLSSIKNLPILFSLSVALTVPMVIGRSYRDSEMAVWNSSGQSIVRWVKPTLLFTFPIACVVAVLTLFIAPWAEREVEERKQELESRDDISVAPPGVFIESRGGDSVFFIDALDRETGKFSGIFVYAQQDGRVSIVSAGSGQSGGENLASNYLVAEDGNRYDIDYKENEIEWTKFSKYGIRIDKRVGGNVYVHQSGKLTSTLFLEPSIENYGELIWRLGLPVSTLLLALLCLSISFEQTRGGKSYAIGVGALLFILYKNVLTLAETQVSQGGISPLLGMIVPHLVVIVVSFSLLLLRSGALSVSMFKLMSK